LEPLKAKEEKLKELYNGRLDVEQRANVRGRLVQVRRDIAKLERELAPLRQREEQLKGRIEKAKDPKR
jgi:hypothetical protein